MRPRLIHRDQGLARREAQGPSMQLTPRQQPSPAHPARARRSPARASACRRRTGRPGAAASLDDPVAGPPYGPGSRSPAPRRRTGHAGRLLNTTLDQDPSPVLNQPRRSRPSWFPGQGFSTCSRLISAPPPPCFRERLQIGISFTFIISRNPVCDPPGWSAPPLPRGRPFQNTWRISCSQNSQVCPPGKWCARYARSPPPSAPAQRPGSPCSRNPAPPRKDKSPACRGFPAAFPLPGPGTGSRSVPSR